MYKELEHQLALVGFTDQEKLEALFRRVDLDGAWHLCVCVCVYVFAYIYEYIYV